MTTKLKSINKEEAMQQEEKIEVTQEEDKEVFPGGPMQSEVDKWKQELRKKGMPDKLFVLAVGGEDIPFVYRRLSRPEYIELLNNVRSPESAEDEYKDDILDTCVLWPKDWTRAKRNSSSESGGTPNTVLDAIMAQSGFSIIGSWSI